MIALFITIGIIILFANEAKRKGENVYKWSIIGLTSYWLTAIIPAYILIENVIGRRGDTIGISITITTILILLIIGGFTSQIVLKKLKKNSSNKT